MPCKEFMCHQTPYSACQPEDFFIAFNLFREKFLERIEKQDETCHSPIILKTISMCVFVNFFLDLVIHFTKDEACRFLTQHSKKLCAMTEVFEMLRIELLKLCQMNHLKVLFNITKFRNMFCHLFMNEELECEIVRFVEMQKNHLLLRFFLTRVNIHRISRDMPLKQDNILHYSICNHSWDVDTSSSLLSRKVLCFDCNKVFLCHTSTVPCQDDSSPQHIFHDQANVIKVSHNYETRNRTSEGNTRFSQFFDQDDELCTDCNDLHSKFEHCAFAQGFVWVSDSDAISNATNSDCQHSSNSCPPDICISPSQIKEGGLGVWCKRFISMNTVFGPYKGMFVKKEQVDDWSSVVKSGYAWEILNQEGKPFCYVDARDEKYSNWLRYVNCARYEEEQNLVAFQYRGNIYYRAYKNIAPGCELLTWYGRKYGENLGIIKRASPPRRKVKSNDGSSYFHCDICHGSFPTRFHVTKHKLYEHSILPHKTDGYSGRKMSREKSMKSWQQWLSSKKKYSAILNPDDVSTNTCSKSFKEKPNGKTSYKCTVCYKTFKFSHVLKKHSLVHTQQKLHQCKVCKKRFRLFGQLKQHEKIHTSRKDFSCNICEKKFYTPACLLRHTRTHSDNRIYHCTYCSAKFTREYTLRYHTIALHTKNFPYECYICGKGFMAPNRLKRHAAKFHKEVL